MISGVDYQKHVPKTMRAHAYRITQSEISTLKVGQTVYRQRERADALLIGHTFHDSLWVDRETLKCHSIHDGRLLMTVEKIK